MAATKITIPRIIEILKEFIVNIIKFIANNVNPIVTKVTLNSSILSSKFFPKTFQGKFIEEVMFSCLYHTTELSLGDKKNGRNVYLVFGSETWLVLVQGWKKGSSGT